MTPGRVGARVVQGRVERLRSLHAPDTQRCHLMQVCTAAVRLSLDARPSKLALLLLRSQANRKECVLRTQQTCKAGAAP